MDPVGAVPTVTPFLLLATSSVEYELDERKKLVSSDRMCPLVSPERPSFQGSYAQQRWPTSRQYAATQHPRRNLNRESGIRLGSKCSTSTRFKMRRVRVSLVKSQ